jgi:hypothetical protein
MESSIADTTYIVTVTIFRLTVLRILNLRIASSVGIYNDAGGDVVTVVCQNLLRLKRGVKGKLIISITSYVRTECCTTCANALPFHSV